uniref:Uncharacterized protein n=1 Tax=Solanum tuberosum TaxID=4113 RepID=M1BMY2_SOLTU
MSRLVDMLRLPDKEINLRLIVKEQQLSSEINSSDVTDSVIELEKLKNEIRVIKTAW